MFTYQLSISWMLPVKAVFLIGLGGTVVGDLPKVEKRMEIDDLLDKAQADRLRDSIKPLGASISSRKMHWCRRSSCSTVQEQIQALPKRALMRGLSSAAPRRIEL